MAIFNWGKKKNLDNDDDDGDEDLILQLKHMLDLD